MRAYLTQHPGLGGLFGYPSTNVPVTDPRAGMTPEQITQSGGYFQPGQDYAMRQTRVPNLPPLAPERQAKETQAILLNQAYQRVQAGTASVQDYQMLGMPLPPELAAQQLHAYTGMFGDLAGQAGAGGGGAGGMMVPRFNFDPTSGKFTMGESLRPVFPQFRSVGGQLIQINPQTGEIVNRGAPGGGGGGGGFQFGIDPKTGEFTLVPAGGARAPSGVPQETGGGGRLGAPPTPATAPRRPAPPPAPATPAKGLPDDTPWEKLPAAPPVGYPSTAFVEGGEVPAQTPGLPMAAHATPASGRFKVPPGWNVTLGPSGEIKNVRIGQPRAIPAVTQRALAVTTTGAEAAQAALDILSGKPVPVKEGGRTVERAAPAPMTILGRRVPKGLQPSMAGPVSGRVLQGLERFSGQPLAQQESLLETAIVHATTPLFGLIGQRPAEGLLARFDPAMPNIHQPQEILEQHLRRLKRFWTRIAEVQESLAGLSPEQKETIVSGIFGQSMTGVGEGDQEKVGPGTIDLRPTGTQ